MDRVLQNSPATASVTFYQDGAVVDPGTVTIGITRADGTELVAPGTATSGTGAAARTYTLSADQTDTLDTLTLTWTNDTQGSRVTYIEVVGGFLFSIADARALSPLGNTSTYTNAEIITARTLAETALEDACGVAFVPRYSFETLSGDGGVNLHLSRRQVRTVRSASVDDVALTASELEDVIPYTPRSLNYTTGWAEGYSNVTVGYEHGMDYPPPRVSRAALLLAKRYLVDSPISDRATSVSNEDGTTQFFVTAGVRGSIFDIPEANAVVQEYGWPDLVG